MVAVTAAVDLYEAFEALLSPRGLVTVVAVGVAKAAVASSS